jgi:hypothetical protein
MGSIHPVILPGLSSDEQQLFVPSVVTMGSLDFQVPMSYVQGFVILEQKMEGFMFPLFPEELYSEKQKY